MTKGFLVLSCKQCAFASKESDIGTRVCQRPDGGGMLTWQERSGARDWHCGMAGRHFKLASAKQMKREIEEQEAA
ncbi:MAG: hypothetical protein ACRCZI_11165 [Cetobacterium sp.]